MISPYFLLPVLALLVWTFTKTNAAYRTALFFVVHVLTTLSIVVVSAVLMLLALGKPVHLVPQIILGHQLILNGVFTAFTVDYSDDNPGKAMVSLHFLMASLATYSLFLLWRL